jgi:hypothetical protein
MNEWLIIQVFTEETGDSAGGISDLDEAIEDLFQQKVSTTP